MRTRLLSAAVLVPVVVIVFWLGRPWTSIGIAVVAILVAWEASTLIRSAGLPANRWLAAVPALLLIVHFELTNSSLTFYYGWPSQVAEYLVIAWVLIAAVDGLRQMDPHQGFLAWAGTLVAGLYAALLAFAVAILTFHVGDSSGNGRFWLLTLVLTVWTLDSAAYVVGKYFPRGQFFNHISPNKTWSGAIGGTVAAVIACVVVIVVLSAGGSDPLSPTVGVVLGIVIAVAAQAGDLTESMVKRAAGVKDSGAMIPGHGGILDRVDSFLFAAPAMFVTLIVLSHTSLGVS
ncbi:MAG: phosphatidate cytidylyltransferase [Candidatus Limnocylindrales bacterium]